MTTTSELGLTELIERMIEQKEGLIPKVNLKIGERKICSCTRIIIILEKDHLEQRN